MKTCEQCNFWTERFVVYDGNAPLLGNAFGECEQMASWSLDGSMFSGLTPALGTCSLFVPLNIRTRRVGDAKAD